MLHTGVLTFKGVKLTQRPYVGIELKLHTLFDALPQYPSPPLSPFLSCVFATVRGRLSGGGGGEGRWCVCVCVCVCVREGGREETDRQTGRQTDREKQTVRQTDKLTDNRQTVGKTYKQREEMLTQINRVRWISHDQVQSCTRLPREGG